MRNCVLAPEHGASQIDPHRSVPNRRVHLGDGKIPTDELGVRIRRIVMQDVESPERFFRGAEEFLKGLLVGDIGADGEALAAILLDCLDNILSPLIVDIADDDGSAFGGESKRAPSTDSRGGAGDHGDSAGETIGVTGEGMGS